MTLYLKLLMPTADAVQASQSNLSSPESYSATSLNTGNQGFWGMWLSTDQISVLPIFGSLFEIFFFGFEPGTKISKNSEELSRDPWTW